MSQMPTYEAEIGLEQCQSEFVATHNPLFVFEAWEWWRWLNRQRKYNGYEALPVPDWIADYLDASASRLLSHVGVPPSAGSGTTLVPWERENQKIGRAFGFPGELDAARIRWGGSFDTKEVRAMEVVKLMEANKLSLDAAARELEEAGGITGKTARRAVEGAHNYALRYMEDALETKASTEEASERADWRDSGWLDSDTPVHIRYSRLCRGLEPD
jgi:hypothetical protein